MGSELKTDSDPKTRGGSPFLVYRRVRVSALPPAFLKRTPDRPLKGSLYWRHWGRSPAIVVSHNGPKNQITWGGPGGPPWRLFPRSYSISLGQMRKHLRGPGQATYDFDGVRRQERGWPAGQTLPSLASLLFAHAIKHMLCFGTSFLCAEKGGKDAGSFAGFLPMKTGGSVIT